MHEGHRSYQVSGCQKNAIFNLSIELFFSNNDPKYAHLTAEDVKKVDDGFKQGYQWLEQTRSKCLSAPKHLPPPVTVAQIRQEKNTFEGTVGPVLNKAPPKAASPPKDEQKMEETKNQNNPEQNQQQSPPQQQQSPENMEWSG